MSYVKINESLLASIADAIRKKNNNLGPTRIETTTKEVTVDVPISKVLKTYSALDANTINEEHPHYRDETDLFGNYEDPMQEIINEDSESWKTATITGATKMIINISYQLAYYGSSEYGRDWLQVMPVATGESGTLDFDSSTGVEVIPTDMEIHTTSLTFDNTDSVSIRMRFLKQWSAGVTLLGYYATVTGYDSDNKIISTQEIQTVTEETEVPNTYTTAEMAQAILKLEPAPYVAYITLANAPTAFFNENFTIEGLEVTAYYSDGTSQVVTNWTSSIEDNTALDPGSHLVTITYTDDNGVTATEDYYVNVYQLNLVTWTDGSDDDIVAMIAAADANRLKLSDYWNIGDERKVTLDSSKLTDADKNRLKYLGFECYVQEAGSTSEIDFGVGFQYERTLVITSFDAASNYPLVDPTAARATPNMVIQFKETSPYTGRLDTADYVGRYDSTSLASALDSVWYKTFPTYLQTIIKEVKVQCNIPPKAPSYQQEGYYNMTAKVFAPAAEEITTSGQFSSSITCGMSKWGYYTQDAANAIKTGPNQTAPKKWWTRNCYTRYQNSSPIQNFYVINTSGLVEDGGTKPTDTTAAIAPAFCI